MAPLSLRLAKTDSEPCEEEPPPSGHAVPSVQCPGRGQTEGRGAGKKN
jgi:hypothetical protein